MGSRQVSMKKTLHIDDELLQAARAASGANTDTEAVRLGLYALVRSPTLPNWIDCSHETRFWDTDSSTASS